MSIEKDTFFAAHRKVEDPATRAFAITPNDGADLAVFTRGLYIGVAGDVVVDMVDSGASITFTALAAGVIHPLRVKRVRATGTTATNIVGVA